MATPLELLAPARDVNIARQAILHGADAVYIGGPTHGARAAASNSIDDIASLVTFAHTYGVKIYVTLNTIVYDPEISQVENDINDLYKAGVDALIIQDMGILRMNIPPIDLHASTQCDIRTPEKARFLRDCGFSQLVLPREFSIDEIKQVRDTVGTDVVLEAFVHGALCVCYSGDCQASFVSKSRSANRGECAQMCRLPYTLIDGNGHTVISDKHLLSLRDLNRLPDLASLVEAGIGSFKIEGRLKDASYVKHTVSAYRKALDKIIDESAGKYYRSSKGISSIYFNPDVNKTFNRGYTPYFLQGRPQGMLQMANIDTPKWIGTRIGTVKKSKGLVIEVDMEEPLNNGDGIGYFDTQRNFSGFRINRVDGKFLYLASPVELAPGTALYRNRNVKEDAILAKDTAERLIDVKMKIEYDNDKLSLFVTTIDGISTSVAMQAVIDVARTPQKEARLKVLSKLGGTPFHLLELDDQLDDSVFIPASLITSIRQKAINQLLTAIVHCHTRRQRRPETFDSPIYQDILTYHDNVSNRLSRQFYIDHGAKAIEPAIEILHPKPKQPVVMTTRYCLRRELGACLLSKEGLSLRGPLHICNDSVCYRLDFDCKNCQMKVVCVKKEK